MSIIRERKLCLLTTRKLALSKVKIFSVIGNTSSDTERLELQINAWLHRAAPCIVSEKLSTCVLNGNIVKTIVIFYTDSLIS